MAQQMSVNNALGTFLGYLGAEAAKSDVFERLLWPARFYNGFNFRSGLQMAFLMPMGGPLHKASLSALDQIRANGLFRGRNQGHMLGSPFYIDMHMKYTVHDCLRIAPPEEEHVRNCLWVRSIANLPIDQGALLSGLKRAETGVIEVGTPTQRNIRAINRVSHLRISLPDRTPLPTEVIGNETGRTTFKIYLALFITEFTGISTGLIVLALWRSWFALLWFAPLGLKLISAFFTLPRAPPKIPSSSRAKELDLLGSSSPLSEKCGLTEPVLKKFEIHDSQNGFLIIEGDENLILQFFRHYGHPTRDRFREYVQFAIIVAFGLIFPLGLLCSILWMPLNLQYTWLAYQLYTALAMCAYRYGDGHAVGTTEQRIADHFRVQINKGEKPRVYFGGEEGVLMAELEVTFHDRVRDGQSHLQKLLFGEKQELLKSTESVYK